MKEFEARWIGWAGVNVPDEVGQKALTKALAEKVQISVFGLNPCFSCLFASHALLQLCFINGLHLRLWHIIHNMLTFYHVMLFTMYCRGVSLYSLMKRLSINITMAIATTFCGPFFTTLAFHKKIALPPPEASSRNSLHIRRQIKCLLMW